MFTISKRFEFSASHQIDGLPPDHQCARLHGHNYAVEVECQATYLNATGFVVDYGELAPFKRWLDEHLDHRHLNDVVDFNPTAERLAEALVNLLQADGSLMAGVDGFGTRWWVTAVRVYETPKTCAEYRP